MFLCMIIKNKNKNKKPFFFGEGEWGKYHIFLMNGHWPMQYVKLNLINHFVSFILCHFALIQHLETLYLCGNHVRLVCERV